MPKTSRETGSLRCVAAVSAVRPSANERAEFEQLDATAPLDEEGRPAWSFQGEPLTARERRWLELYLKLENHEEAGSPNGRRQ
ncbi:hypothetical protein QCM77_25335 [Bradyrhizobium sp. SSUT18]|uniref:hypothetical protein n=1 Tax=unclassified Bradyrhizobium TaxID=2631580 RepID=UPI00244B7BF8|nr:MULTISPECIES: hypothetical protein [unclassified Bradyrhizobium]MDH2347983.1 hypothetical protein [Bradyrhizobium sp. SSUT77]MDH2356726.1 hypothetical protein [Bradyrhizobium sp. SSUT112]MDH2403244.1 hypothetical protein [Bradyrhizobium sp. SSUT18]